MIERGTPRLRVELRQDFFAKHSLFMPTGLTGANYARTFESGILHYFLNSVIVTLACMVAVLAVSLPLAYAIARLRGAYTAAVFRLLLLGLAVPIQATIIPIYVLMVHMGLYDTLFGLGLIWRLVAPLSQPALATVAICNAIQTWNNFLFPLVLTQSTSAQTLPLALQSFEGEFGIDIPGLMAAVVLSALPSVCLYIVAQRQLVSGLTAGFGR